MTTINTVEDLIRALDENPQWLEILRARILTKEVLELPQRLAEFAAAADRRAEQHAQDNKAQFNAIDRRFDAADRRAEQHAQDNKAQFEAIDRRFDAVEQRAEQHEQANNERFDAIERRAEQHEQANNERFETLEQKMDRYQAANNARFDGIDRHLRSIDNTLSYLKGAHATMATLKNAGTLARDLGLRRVRDLTVDDLWDLTDAADTADLAANVLRSFHNADLIIEARDTAGETCYIAVEVSFTVNGRDTARAIRNAALLTRFTGRKAHAVISGRHKDDRIDSHLESGEVFWFQLEDEDLAAR